MRSFLGFLLGTALLGVPTLAAADSPAPSPASNWVLSSDQFYTYLLANWSSEELTYIYRICETDGAAVRVSTAAVSGQPVTLSKGQCVDVATQGSVRLTRADATGTDTASGTYQFIHATPVIRAVREHTS